MSGSKFNGVTKTDRKGTDQMTRRYRRRSNVDAQKQIEARTNEIVIGDTYWLSSFGDSNGHYVKVIDTSTKQNRAGWNSTVTYEVVSSDVPSYPHMLTMDMYAVGAIGTCNATNLYENRKDAA